MKHNIWIESNSELHWYNPISWIILLFSNKKWKVMYEIDNNINCIGKYRTKEEAMYNHGLCPLDIKK